MLVNGSSNNIGQIAYLQSEKHDLEHIYFAGSFIGGYRQTMKTLSNAINFWSDGSKKAYFLRHEGYLGSVGAVCTCHSPFFFLVYAAVLLTDPWVRGQRHSLISKLVLLLPDTLLSS